jgi:endonuclease/exonuclease/phosphatase family metal-dependent hydrolase
VALAGADVVLLSEMDVGMARTAQRHTPAEIARRLGMAYAFGVEFLELGLGAPIEREFCLDDHNERGFHGNAVLARGALGRPFLLRLPGARQWFGDAEQPRLGERMALGAQIDTPSGPVLVVSTHLESACGAAHRGAQMAALIAALDAGFPGLPVLIGGDLNTGNHAGGDWRAEPLFEIARAAGFSVQGGDEDTPTTRPSLITRFPDRSMKLDWFLARGLRLGRTEIHPALDASGRPLSDHDRIECLIEAVTP